ncbi:hypothetical protein [Oerskovia flava]|uniref:hypothetical protein n=1 Tax=Oerskovia flava TaxID=2986422 RepID=UPI00223F0E30|nr:hypothetical protein [Oerskovia sp. JB1-3-2]
MEPRFGGESRGSTLHQVEHEAGHAIGAGDRVTGGTDLATAVADPGGIGGEESRQVAGVAADSRNRLVTALARSRFTGAKRVR